MQNLAKAESLPGRARPAIGRHVYEVCGSRDCMRVETTRQCNYTIASQRQTWQVDEDGESRHAAAGRFYYSRRLDDRSIRCGWWTFADDTVADAPTSRQRGSRMAASTADLSLPARRPKGDYELRSLVDARTRLPVSIRRRTSARPDRSTWANCTSSAFNQPLDAAKLKVPATLTEDGRIGKVTDWQGNVALRPLTSTRWTPVCDQPILRPGDWLRTDFQGANAVTVQLAPQTKLILGPGSLVELTQARSDHAALRHRRDHRQPQGRQLQRHRQADRPQRRDDGRRRRRPRPRQ